jgi:E3 UFM1-protein ligase 1
MLKYHQVVRSLISSYDITGSVLHSKEYRPQAYQEAQEAAAAARYTADGYIEFTTASQVSRNCYHTTCDSYGRYVYEHTAHQRINSASN